MTELLEEFQLKCTTIRHAYRTMIRYGYVPERSLESWKDRY